MFPAQNPVTRRFDVFFDLRLNKGLSKQSGGGWFETPSRPLWCHCNDLNVLHRNMYKMSGYIEKIIFFMKRYWVDITFSSSLLWCHNGCDGVWNHQPHDCLLNCSFRPRSKKISKPRVIALCAGNSPVISEFPAQMASNAVNVSIWWRHHGKL